MRRSFLRFRVFSFLGILIYSIAAPLQVLAIDESFYSKNDILFSNPDAVECATGSATSAAVSGGINSIIKSPNLELIFSALVTGGLNGVQAAAVMGNMYAESGFNSDARESNGIGYGLAQWSFGRRTAMENYVGNPTSNTAKQVEFLLKEYNESYKSRLSETEFENATDIAMATTAWMMKFEVPAMRPVNDPAALNSKRIPAAQKVYELYKDLSPANSPVTITNCSSGNGAVSGSIVDTALGFAQTTPVPNGKASKSDALMSYQTAKQSLNPGTQWSDCGAFVATVMIASGVDPNYAKVGVSGAQIPYVRSHPEKYQIIENPTGVNDLQPGDILLTTSHTLIYTGKTPYPGVDASLNQRVPGVRPMSSITWIINNNAIVARVIK